MNLELVRTELERHRWSNIRSMRGSADQVPAEVLRLITADTLEGAQSASSRLESFIVVQGQLFESAYYVLPVLLAGLECGPARIAREWIIELVFQCVAGEAHEIEVNRGFAELGDKCREQVRGGLWVLYREFLDGMEGSVFDILEIVENDRDRLVAFVATRPESVEQPSLDTLREAQQRARRDPC